MLNLLLTAALFAPQGPGSSTAPVVINEFSYDDSGTDNLEFIELYNRSNVPVDISGWVVLNPDSSGPTYGSGTGVDLSYTIPPGTILQPGAFWVLGPANLNNVNQVIGVNNLLENDAEAIELRDQNGVIIDSVTYELGGVGGAFGPHPIEGNGLYGDLSVGDAAGQPFSSIARIFDGYDTNDNGRDFTCCVRATPGASNNIANALPYADNFDNGSIGVNIFGWTGGWVDAKYVDPTAVSSQNLSAKPFSPQGGLAMSTWDSSGGGNSVQLATSPLTDVVFESYVWFEPVMAPVNPASYSPSVPPALLDHYNIGDGEWWAVGVRGTAAANGNPPDVGNYFGTISLGVGVRPHFVTGIAWAHFRTPSVSQLYLIDFGNGAAPGNPNNYTILAGPIAVTQGWHRLRLHVQGNTVMANYGGNYGADDGQRFVATTNTTTPGNVYIAYREAILYNNNGQAGCRPPLFDDVSVHVPTTTKTFVGNPSPTTIGAPNIDSDGFLMIGSNGFGILASGLVPLGAPNYLGTGLVIGFGTLPGGYPIAGTPPTVTAYVIPAASFLAFADNTGRVRFPFLLPRNPRFLGSVLGFQVVDLDANLPFAVPVGTSRALDMTIGR